MMTVVLGSGTVKPLLWPSLLVEPELGLGLELREVESPETGGGGRVDGLLVAGEVSGTVRDVGDDEIELIVTGKLLIVAVLVRMGLVNVTFGRGMTIVVPGSGRVIPGPLVVLLCVDDKSPPLELELELGSPDVETLVTVVTATGGRVVVCAGTVSEVKLPLNDDSSPTEVLLELGDDVSESEPPVVALPIPVGWTTVLLVGTVVEELGTADEV